MSTTAAPRSSAIAAVPFDFPKASDYRSPEPLLPRATREVESISAFATLDLAADGSLYFNGRKLSSADELVRVAKQASEGDPDLRAVIRADRNAPWGQVVHMMDLLKQANISRIAFAVEAPTP